MTAKQMAKEYITSGLNAKGKLIKYYAFPEKEFKQFIDQLCKEQRDICSKELQKKVLMNRDTKNLAKMVVLNAPQPNIFEKVK